MASATDAGTVAVRVQVIDVAYLLPGDSVADGITGYDKVPMKGQSEIALGAGPIGAKVTTQLATLTGTYTNVNGVTAAWAKRP